MVARRLGYPLFEDPWGNGVRWTPGYETTRGPISQRGSGRETTDRVGSRGGGGTTKEAPSEQQWSVGTGLVRRQNFCTRTPVSCGSPPRSGCPYRQGRVGSILAREVRVGRSMCTCPDQYSSVDGCAKAKQRTNTKHRRGRSRLQYWVSNLS